MPEGIEIEHIYQAETTVLAGRIKLPTPQDIVPFAYVSLAEKGGYEQHRVGAYNIESILSLQSAYTQVAGHPAAAPCEGSVTMSTAVIEGLNIFDVVTADRVVAQATTIHPINGYVPEITFLGTRFDNLRIAGKPVDIDLDLNVLGPKPVGDAGYISSEEFLSRAAKQHEEVRKHSHLSAELLERYNQVPKTVNGADGRQETVECSLVNRVVDPAASIFSRAETTPPFHSSGHVIKIPHFGTLELARLRVYQSDYNPQGVPKKTTFHLTMVDLILDCTNDGHFRCCEFITNGGGRP